MKNKKEILYEIATKEARKNNPDLKKVALLLQQTMKINDHRATYALATWYLHGKLFKKNYKKATRLLRIAAKANIPAALYDLAICYEKGAGVKKDLNKAVESYLKAALLGNKQSIYELGRCMYYGIGIQKNRDLANILLQIGSPKYQLRRYHSFKKYMKSLKEKSKKYINSEYRKKAVECYLKAALLGDKQSIYELGRCMYYGIGIQKNRDLANILLEKVKSKYLLTNIFSIKEDLESISNKIEKCIDSDQWNKARNLIKLALKINPKDHWLLTRLALTYYEQHNYKKALKFNMEAIKLAPRCPLVLWDYAGSLDMLGRYKEALKIYNRLVKRDVKSIAYGQCGEGARWAKSLVTDCLYRIGGCYRKQGDQKKAIKFYNKHIKSRKPGIPSIYPLDEVIRDFNEWKEDKIR